MTWFDRAKAQLAKWQAGRAAPDVYGSNFTPRAMQAMRLAQKEAQQLNHNYLGTEHLLLGLIKLNQGICIDVLRKLGINPEEIYLHLKKSLPIPSSYNLSPIPYTPRTKRVIALAQKDAKLLHHTYLGTEHLLLGIIEEGNGEAARALLHFGLDLKKTRKEILKELDPNYSPPDRDDSGKS